MSDKIVWINHAGYELNIGGLKIVHDPWLSGLAFDDGWSLCSKTLYEPENFEYVDYIWFSHEHPDHFSPASIKSIPLDFRSNITVLFQETRDKRVIEFCKRAGFKVLELMENKPTALNDRVIVRCGKVGRDSWIYTETKDISIFNANDCVGVNWNRIASSLPRRPDILLTQFSYANWVGNIGEHDRMKAQAKRKLIEMRQQINALQPSVLIPFASYIWFCHEQNFHMNENSNKIEDVYDTFKNELEVVVLYPNDEYKIGSKHDSSTAINLYKEDLKLHKEPLKIDGKSFSLDEIKSMVEIEQRRLKNDNWIWVLSPLAWLRVIKPVAIWFEDISQGIRYSMFGGIIACEIDREHCDLSFRSGSFALMLSNGYGFGTLSVNGKYIELRPGGARALGQHFAIAARNEEGDNIPSVFLNMNYMQMQFGKLITLILHKFLCPIKWVSISRKAR